MDGGGAALRSPDATDELERECPRGALLRLIRSEPEDGVVWRILPGEAAFTISQDYEQVPEQPRLYRPQRTNHAMLNQKTGFLTHPLPLEDTTADSLEDWFELGDEKVSLTKLLIPAAEKAYFRHHLATMGIDHSTLFPAFADFVATSAKRSTATDSYDWVFPE